MRLGRIAAALVMAAPARSPTAGALRTMAPPLARSAAHLTFCPHAFGSMRCTGHETPHVIDHPLGLVEHFDIWALSLISVMLYCFPL